MKLESTDQPLRRRLELLVSMFPGQEQLILCFSDTGKRLAAQCVVHPALVEELQELMGEQNVAVR